MKRLYAFGLFLTMLFGIGFSASALKATIEWDTPGSIKLQLESNFGDYVDLAPDQTSYTYETSKTYGYVYVTATDNYKLLGAETTDGTKKFSVSSSTPPRISISLYASDDNKTIKVSTEKLERNDVATIDVVNGLANIYAADFASGYSLELAKGSHEYKFNASYDDPFSFSYQAVKEAYSVTLNGTPVKKNQYRTQYDNIQLKNGDVLKIQMYEDDSQEPEECKLTFAYGAGMEGSVLNFQNTAIGKFYYPDQLTDNSINVLQGTELRINFNNEDYTIEKVTINGTDVTKQIVTSTFNGSQFINVTVNDAETTFMIEGTPKVYADISFTGYIENGEGVEFSMTYGGAPFTVSDIKDIEKDIVLSLGSGEDAKTITLPAATTKEYTITVPEKTAKFFFGPKTGYYISGVYLDAGNGKVEYHSGSASITEKIDGTSFYMIAEKLAAPYTADLSITGTDFNMRVFADNAISGNWNNPGAGTFSSTPGEREISFIPGYGTPITFGFVGDESRKPAVYLDGGEVSGFLIEDSGATEYYVTPYYPTEDSTLPAGTKSKIEIYNSFTERPTMSGATLQLEDDMEAEFFYSEIMHPANPEGQAVISGTQFTVRPADPKATVAYKGEVVKLNENGEYIFNATGNARNNIVKVSAPGDFSGIGEISSASENLRVYSIDGKLLNSVTSREGIESLDKGIYIVNGKKVIVK